MVSNLATWLAGSWNIAHTFSIGASNVWVIEICMVGILAQRPLGAAEDGSVAFLTVRQMSEVRPVPSQQPLAGVRIIECSMLGPGAITTSLADMGADVIKVEPPAG
ncbi:MAG TPA: CoA transferase, partial [Microthrixaceae bacterium]|nr:CoA transferase [Microthrixaceae bacterium]